MESPIYSIIIPAYNEAQRIGATLEKIITYISQQSWHVELIVVNDGSRDNTVEVVNSYKSRAPYLRVVENPGNRGKGYSVRNGMLHASGDLLLFTDADLSAPIYEAEKLFDAIQAGADVAIGSRWLVRALQKEREARAKTGQRTVVLIPITVDDILFEVDTPLRATLLQRYVGDFRRWKDRPAYTAALEMLIEALKTDRLPPV